MRSNQASAVTIVRPRRWLPDAEVVALAAVLTVLVVLVVVPVAVLVWRSLTPGGSVSLDAYRVAFAGVSLASLTMTTVAFAVGASLLGLGLGTALAVALVGTDLPGRRIVLVLALSPLLLPGVLQTIAWIFLAAPQSGALSGIPGMPSIFGLGGMIFVEGIRLAPIALLLVGAALRAGDPALEEAALMAGAGRLSVLRRVTLPLLLPALPRPRCYLRSARSGRSRCRPSSGCRIALGSSPHASGFRSAKVTRASPVLRPHRCRCSA